MKCIYSLKKKTLLYDIDNNANKMQMKKKNTNNECIFQRISFFELKLLLRF